MAARAAEAKLADAEALLEAAKAGEPPAEAIAALRDVALSDPTTTDPDMVKAKDRAVAKLADAYAGAGDAQAVAGLLAELRPSFASLPKAKTAKIVRTVIDTMAKVPESTKLQVSLSTPACCDFPGLLPALGDRSSPVACCA